MRGVGRAATREIAARGEAFGRAPRQRERRRMPRAVPAPAGPCEPAARHTSDARATRSAGRQTQILLAVHDRDRHAAQRARRAQHGRFAEKAAPREVMRLHAIFRDEPRRRCRCPASAAFATRSPVEAAARTSAMPPRSRRSADRRARSSGRATRRRCAASVRGIDAHELRVRFGRERGDAVEEPVEIVVARSGTRRAAARRSTRSRWRAAYASASAAPHEPPATSQRSMPSCSRSASMSAISASVWLCAVSPSGVLRPAAALVELHDAIARASSDLALPRAAAGARAAVQQHDRNAVARAGLLVIDAMAVADVEPAGVERGGRGRLGRLGSALGTSIRCYRIPDSARPPRCARLQKIVRPESGLGRCARAARAPTLGPAWKPASAGTRVETPVFHGRPSHPIERFRHEMGNPASQRSCASASKSRCTSQPAEADRRDAPADGLSAGVLAALDDPAPPRMHVHVLGSAAGGGFPQWNCNCRNCAGVRGGTLQREAAHAVVDRRQPATARAGCSCNASPDILAQIRADADAAAGARAARHRDPRRRADGCADRPRDRPLHAARASAAARRVVHRPRARGPRARQPAVARCSATTAASTAHRIPLDGEVFVIPTRARPRFRRAALRSKAPPYSPHRDQPGRRATTSALEITDRRERPPAVLRAGPRARSTPTVFDAMAARRLRAGRRHLLDRRRDDRARRLEEDARATSATCRSRRRGRHDRVARRACRRARARC